MRPDTYQIYENITVKNITGSSGSVIDMKPWKQFFDLEGSDEKPYGIVRNILIENVNAKVKTLGTIAGNQADTVSNFVMRNINVEAENPTFECVYPEVQLENVVMNGKTVENPAK